MLRLAHAFVAVAVLITAGEALAAKVFLNGVAIDGVTNQKFEKALVRIDDQGNVHIEVEGYSVRVEQGGRMSPPIAAAGPSASEAVSGPPRLTRRYWLVTEQTAVGMTDYDVDLYINAKWVRKLRGADEQLVTELTRHLVPGRNTVLMTARKVIDGERKSDSPGHTFKVIIGEGNIGGDNVMIDRPVVKFTRNAAETEDVSQEFSFTTR
jgi:hypothetical protein